MYQITLSYNDHQSLLSEIARRFETGITILDCNPRFGSKGCDKLIEIEVLNNHDDEIISYLKVHPKITSIDIVHSRRNILLAAITTNQADACNIFHSIDCFRILSQIKKNGKFIWKLIFSDEMESQKLFMELKQHGLDAKLISKTNIDEKSVLTLKQEKILQVALKRGYFDYPKRINIRELAKIFEVSYLFR